MKFALLTKNMTLLESNHMKLKYLKRHLHQNERERVNQKNIPDFERSDFFQHPFCYLHRNLAMYGGTYVFP